ncbi:MAG: hypothetical protein AAGF87_02530 [Bacteroidota bacterium]
MKIYTLIMSVVVLLSFVYLYGQQLSYTSYSNQGNDLAGQIRVIGNTGLAYQDGTLKPNFQPTIIKDSDDTLNLTVLNIDTATIYIPSLGSINNYFTIKRPNGIQTGSGFIDHRHGIELTDENTLSPMEQHTFTVDAKWVIFGFIPQREEDRGVFKLQWTFYDTQSEVIELEFW